MFGKLFGERPTTRSDIALAMTGAFFACFKAWDVSSRYKAEQKAKNASQNQENTK